MTDVVFAYQGTGHDALFTQALPSAPDGLVIAGVVVSPASATVAGGGTLQFTATALGTGPITQTFTWETTYGTVSASGQVTELSAGLADIVGVVRATSTQDPSRSGIATFTVLAVEVAELDKASRFARPVRDLVNIGWAASAGTDLFDMLNDPVPDSSDFISASGPARYEGALGPVADPGTSSGQAVRYEAHAEGGGSLTVNFKQGEILIASWHHATLPEGFTIHEQFLTPEQCDAITDYSNLRVETVIA